MNGSSSWIEPPPAQRGLGCFAKGCLILVVFFILLAAAFVAGTYYAAKYLRTEYFSMDHERLPISQATVEEEQTVRARWDAFEKAAHAHEAARIALSGDDLNALIASEPQLHGNAYVTIEDSTAHLQLSMPIGKARWLRGRYLNAQCEWKTGRRAHHQRRRERTTCWRRDPELAVRQLVVQTLHVRLDRPDQSQDLRDFRWENNFGNERERISSRKSRPQRRHHITA
jgi:hypothetical protein